MHARRSPGRSNVPLSLDEIDKGILKLRRRIDEVNDLDPRSTHYDDTRIANARTSIWSSDEDRQRQFADEHPRAILTLKHLIERLGGKRFPAFEGLQLHPRIVTACGYLYRDGHYRNAVLDACLALEDYVKQKSRCRDRDGADLMRYVFSKNNPVLAFNALTDDTDRSEQEGMMHLFEGVMLALRNPRAHALSDDSPEQALEYIALLSLLAKRLEGANRLSDQ